MSTKKEHRQKAKADAVLMSRYQKLFNSHDGQEILKDLFKVCRMNQSSYNGDANDTMYNEGSRAVGLHILKMLKTDHSKYLELIDKSLEKGDYYYDEELV